MGLYIDDRRVIPAPFVQMQRNINFTPDGRPLSPTYLITLQGTLLPNKGSPFSYDWHYDETDPPDEYFVNTDDKFNAILAKQELLKEALGHPGFTLRWESDDFECNFTNGILQNLSFAPGAWVQLCNYTATVQTDSFQRQGTDEPDYEDTLIAHASGLNLSAVTDSWSVRERPTGPTGIFEVGHQLSATARAQYSSTGVLDGSLEPWERAKAWVDARLAASSGFDSNYNNIPETATQYNMNIEESIDEFGGTYSLNRSFIYTSQNYIETRRISRQTTQRATANSGAVIERINVNGTIVGLDAAGNEPSGKIINASSYLSTLDGNIGALVGANGDARTNSFDYDYENGSVSYAYEFVNASESTASHDYTVNYTFNQGSVSSVTIQGTIQGITSDDSPDNKYSNAESKWGNVESTVRTLAFAEANDVFNGIDDSDFAGAASSKQVSFNKADGSISYTFTYNYVGGDGGDNYSNEFTINFETTNTNSVLNANQVTATINGNIVGFSSGDDPSERINNAIAAWDTFESSLFTEVDAYYSSNNLIGENAPSLRNLPVTKSVALNKSQGSLSYSCAFNNEPGTPTGVAIMDVNIDQQYPTDVFAVQVIPGRAIGPIIQDVGTITEARRNINIALTMHPISGAHWPYNSISVPRTISNQLISSGVSDLDTYYIAADSDNWNWKAGLYTRTYTVVYATGQLGL